jgi:signal transduction histidine kinase/FixJ family two-component response regulator
MRPKPESLRDYREYPILYVDDEPENLRIFELTFRREFAILTARSGSEGLEIIQREPVALVLSDHRMPGMTGTEFLARVRQLDSKTLRIMVTAYGDVETLESAINDGSIYRFVPKPWTPEEMGVTLRRGIDAYALEREREQLLHELGILHRISGSLARELDLERLSRLVLNTLVKECGFDAAGLMTYAPREQALTWERGNPKDPDLDPILRGLRFDTSTCPRFLERLHNGRTNLLRLEDALDYEPPVRRLVTEIAAGQVLIVGLHGKDDLIGALCVDNRRGRAGFSSDDQTLMEGLSNQAAIALENARLVEDLRRSREQIRRADRLGSLGTLAAGLAHEINNPLVSINTFLAMAPAKRYENDSEFWGGYHALACKEVERIKGLVETMRRLGRGSAHTMPRETVSVPAIVEEVVTLLHREAELGKVSLRAEATPDVPKIVAVRDHVHQVLLNLVLNAIGATSAGGKVVVRCSAGANGLLLEVHDTGAGIPPEHIDQIFDPFFTTKDPDQGTGLGLMVCHRIVSDHGGSIEVRSREGEGTCFSVFWPIDARAPQRPLDPLQRVG